MGEGSGFQVALFVSENSEVLRLGLSISVGVFFLGQRVPFGLGWESSLLAGE